MSMTRTFALRSITGGPLPGVKVRARQPSPGGLIFGLIRLRSPAFIGIQIDVAVQVADVNGLR
jgi:hypothetical protein